MVRLQAGPLVCEVDPSLGGCVMGLWHGDTPVLRSTHSPPTTARQSGCYPLVPYSNRIAHARLQWQGTLYPLVRNNGDEAHAIHGVGWQRSWELLDSDERFALLSYEHRPDSSWPFAFDSSQSYRLSPDSLELSLSVTNQSARVAPVGLGWHPFFMKRAQAHLSFVATGRWEMDEDKLPTRRLPCSGIEADCSVLDLDHCYDGWSGTAMLADSVLRIRVSSNLSRIVIFTNPARDVIAIEPVSHVNNALALAAQGMAADELGLATLEPGESVTASMTIAVERVE
ncbi:MAG TPA: aldose 1-epimerase [Ramlibacter sp.]|nr:aldose 1-epimerase [Ramlibacter sp.]